MGDKPLGVEGDARARQRLAKIEHHAVELRRRARSSRPDDAVMPPVAGPVEDQGCGARRDLRHGPLDRADAVRVDGSDESEREVQVLWMRSAPSAKLAQLARPRDEP